MSKGADRTIETAGREVQAGITAGADKTVVFWGFCFLCRGTWGGTLRHAHSWHEPQCNNAQKEGTRAPDELDIVQKGPDPCETNGPVAVTACRSAEWGPQQMCKLVTVRRFERDELTLHQHTSQFAAFCLIEVHRCCAKRWLLPCTRSDEEILLGSTQQC